MTLAQTAHELYKLSLAGFFNGQQFTLQGFTKYLETMFTGTLKLGNAIVLEIALPDGRWLFKITEYKPGKFDYAIPDTREQEAHIYAELIA